MNIDGIILAAGLSRRMGANKLLLPFRGKPIVRHVLDLALGLPLASVILVTSEKTAGAVDIPPGVRLVINTRPDQGQALSLRLGLERATGAGYLFFAADQPLLDEATVRSVLALAGDECIVAPKHGDRVGNPVFFPAKFAGELMTLEGDTGGRSVRRRHCASCRFAPASSAAALWDVDTPAHYQRLLAGEENNNRPGTGTAMPEHRRARNIIVVRGGGDIATGVIQKLWRAGFHVAALETPEPLTIRRTVAVSTAVREDRFTIEDLTAVRVSDASSCEGAWAQGFVPVLADPHMTCLDHLRPTVLVDAVIAKKNTGMHPGLAPVTIALGPGFSAPRDVDCVVETMRGHFLGRLISDGEALPDTGIPGTLGGKNHERVIYAPRAGKVEHARRIGDTVEKDEILFSIDGLPVRSRLTGTLRGLIAEGVTVRQGVKCADVDPRPAREVDCHSISDKARAVGGAVLEACLMLAGKKGLTLRPDRYAEAPAGQESEACHPGV